jgi:predicted NAD/FAD-dependent oxidoreductase
MRSACHRRAHVLDRGRGVGGRTPQVQQARTASAAADAGARPGCPLAVRAARAPPRRRARAEALHAHAPP